MPSKNLARNTALSNGSGPHRPRPSQERESPKTWADRLRELQAAYGNVPGAFRLVWAADKTSTMLMGLLTLIGGGLPLTQAWVALLIVDAVVAAVNQGVAPLAGLQVVAPYLLLEFGLLMLGAFLAQVRRLIEHLLNSRLAHHINMEIIRKALVLDLQYFEDAEFYDKLQNARREADWRALGIINGSFLLVQNLITLTSFAITLLLFSPLIALLLFGAAIPSFVAQNRFSSLSFRLLNWRAPEYRRMQYYEHVLTVDASVKEVKLFGLGEPLLARYADMFWKIFHEDASLAKRRSLVSLWWGLVATASLYAAYGWVVYQTVATMLTLGGMTLYLTVIRQTQGTFLGLFDNLNRLYENGLFMDSLFSYLDMQPQVDPDRQLQAVPAQIVRGIEFRNVSFRYPGRTDWALRNLNLTIAPGEKLALVGQNGAGKTTLIKLLTRLYDPTEGAILLDGVDLRDYPVAELQRKIGVIFQDFVRYQLTMRENIGFGQIEQLADTPRITSAAERGGATEVASELPDGIETMLGRWFDKGHELSGGQWQKIALGRAFMRDSEVLVLDEPTAALDAEREYEIFQRFRALTTDKIAVLISHRFSTVRMADRIAVIEDGQIAELGSHAELLALNGTYARLFEMQAKGYR